MNLKSIPDTVWLKLTKEAIEAKRTQSDVGRGVRSLFYSHIYSKWSQGKVTYSPNLAGDMDAGWDTMVGEWTKVERSQKSLGDVLKDDSVGKAYVQGKGGPESSVRLWEKYNKQARGDRFQFVVTMGGGMVLFNRMRRACQTYIIEKLKGDPSKFVVRGWKVFGEQQGEGRSDSCCVYLACKYTDRNLTTLVNKYIWPNIQDLVDSNFVPLGFYKVCNKPLWAMRMPPAGREQAEFGQPGKGSAGGLMASVFAKGFTNAIAKEDKDEKRLMKLAKAEVKTIVKRLYA